MTANAHRQCRGSADPGDLFLDCSSRTTEARWRVRSASGSDLAGAAKRIYGLPRVIAWQWVLGDFETGSGAYPRQAAGKWGSLRRSARKSSSDGDVPTTPSQQCIPD